MSHCNIKIRLWKYIHPILIGLGAFWKENLVRPDCVCSQPERKRERERERQRMQEREREREREREPARARENEMMMLAFITFNSSLVPLLEGLSSSNPWEFEFSDFRRNRTDDLGMNSPSL